MTFSTFHRRQAGFTFIELMVVISIIGVLATISVTQFNRVTRKTKLTEPLITLRSLYSAITAYYAQTGAVFVPTTTLALEPGQVVTSPDKNFEWTLPPDGRQRWRYYYWGPGTSYAGVMYAYSRWYDDATHKMDKQLLKPTSASGAHSSWVGGTYYLTYIALDFDGNIYGYTSDGQILTLSDNRSNAGAP